MGVSSLHSNEAAVLYLFTLTTNSILCPPLLLSLLSHNTFNTIHLPSSLSQRRARPRAAAAAARATDQRFLSFSSSSSSSFLPYPQVIVFFFGVAKDFLGTEYLGWVGGWVGGWIGK